MDARFDANEAETLSNAIAQEQSLAARIALITKSVPGRLVFSTTLGLEDQAVLHAIAATHSGIEVLTLDTCRHFPETLATLARSERHFGIRIRVIAPDTNAVENLVARDGIDGFRRSVDARKA